MTLEQMVTALITKNPQNNPMNTLFIAKTLWPDACWLNANTFRHGGPKRGQWVAAGHAAKMVKRGLLRHSVDHRGCFHWVERGIP